jgi:hypothetical protein
MRRTHVAIVVFTLAFTGLMTSAGSAENRWKLDVSPTFFVDGTGDSTAAPLRGTVAAYCPGYAGAPIPPACHGFPRNTSDLRLDYGVTYRFSKKLNLEYTHSAFDYSIGRVTSIPPLSVLTGNINDRIDRISLNYAAGHGLALDAHYFSDQRSSIEATASPVLHAVTGSNCYFNSMKCPGGASNPASINSNAWGAGASYSFGPHGRFQPPMFKAAVDADYYPRPLTRSAATCVAAGAAANAPVCGANGIPGYVGSQTVLPYSLTVFPLSTAKIKPGFIPFLAYQRIDVLFHAENTPEAYNGTAFGLVKALGHGMSFNYTNLHLNGCRCSATVPAPDSIRSVVNILKFTYTLGS